MPVNDIIKEAEYNGIRNKLINVINAGSGNSGWGQPLKSSAVAVGNKVTINEWANLRYDIINAHTHIYGSAPSTVTVAEGNTIRYNVSDAPVTTYDTLVNTIVANRFTVHSSQSATNVPSAPSSTTWPGPYGSYWTTKLACTIDVVWPDANSARYFFNSGGQVRIASSRSGGSTNSQNSQWTSILSTAGTQSFGGNNPGTGTTPNDGTNWYRLSNSFQQFYSLAGSSPYGSNTYKIYSKCADVVSNSSGTSRHGQFYLEFTDSYVDPGQHPSNPVPDTIDAVDGTFSVSVSLLYATGVLVPAGFGNFTVTLPTVSIGAIAPA